MQTRLVKVTLVLEVHEDVNGDFVLDTVDQVLEPGEKIVGFWTEDTDQEKLESEGFGDYLFSQ